MELYICPSAGILAGYEGQILFYNQPFTANVIKCLYFLSLNVIISFIDNKALPQLCGKSSLQPVAHFLYIFQFPFSVC